MFRAQAHSFQQQARLAISLSWIAGYTNALTVLICDQVVSHMTGPVSRLGVELAEGHWSTTGYLFGLICAFVFGAIASGVMTDYGRWRRLQSIYVLPMFAQATVLGLFAMMVDWQAVGRLGPSSAHIGLTYLPAFAMGLQNATITRISGGVVRTTHVTGVLTDLGLELAKAASRSVGFRRRLDLRRASQEHWRTLLLLSIPCSFAFGAVVGTFAFDYVQAWSMVPAVAFLGVLVAIDLLVPIAAVELRTGSHTGASVVAVYHAELPAAAATARMPDLTTWANGLDEHVRVVVIDIGNLRDFGERSALELRALMLHLREEGRPLVLAGLGREQIASLQHAGVMMDFDADDLCSDVGSAVRRAEELLALAAARNAPAAAKD